MKKINLLFWLYKSKENQQGLCPLYLRITVQGQRKNLATPFGIPLTCWDNKKQKVKGKYELADCINNYIDLVKVQVHQLQNSSNLTRKQLTPLFIKQSLLGQNPDKKTLLEVVNYHNAKLKELVGKDVSIGTYKRYEVTRRKLQLFIRDVYSQDDILLEEIKYKFITDFEFYLKTKFKIDQNTAIKYLKQLKKIIKEAAANDWIEKNPFQYFKCVPVLRHRGFLTNEELSLIESRIFENERLNLVKDVFLFSCYTGLSYSDVEKLKRENIFKSADNKEWIAIQRTKTKESCNIPVLPKAAAILKKYTTNPECCIKGKLLPVRSNQKINEYLKEMANLCGITKRVSFHLARHTFATTVTLANGVSMEVVGRMLGHRSLRTTQIYAKMVDHRVSNEMRKLETLLNTKK